jgi:hypothetical protein
MRIMNTLTRDTIEGESVIPATDGILLDLASTEGRKSVRAAIYESAQPPSFIAPQKQRCIQDSASQTPTGWQLISPRRCVPAVEQPLHRPPPSSVGV